MNSNVITVIFCLFIIGYFFYNLWFLCKESQIITLDLKKALNCLPGNNERDNFAKEYNKIDDEMESNKTFKHSWSEFKEHLILPKNGKGSVQNSVQPNEYFSIFQIIHNIDFKSLDAVGSMLTGMGILGTFIGLAWGIYSLSESMGNGDQAVLMKGIEGLMGGAFSAFFTSVMGLSCSLLFTYLERKKMFPLRKDLASFNKKLERCLEFAPVAKLMLEAINQKQIQNEHLEAINENLSINMNDIIDDDDNEKNLKGLALLVKSVRDLKDSQVETSEKFYENMADKVSGGLSDFAGKQTEKIKDDLERFSIELPKIIDSIKIAQENSQEQMKVTINEIQKTFTSNQSTMTKQAEDTLSSLRGTLEKVGENMMSQVKQAQSEIQSETVDSFKKVNNHLREEREQGFKQQSDTTEKLLNAINKFSISMTDMKTNVIKFENLASSISDESLSIEKRRNEVNKQLSESLRISQNYQSSIQSLHNVNKELHTLSSELKVFPDSIKENVQKIEDSNEAIQKTWSSYEQRFLDVDESARNLFKNIDSGLKEYSKETYTQVQNIKTGMEKVAGSFGGAIQELQDTIEDLDAKKK